MSITIQQHDAAPFVAADDPQSFVGYVRVSRENGRQGDRYISKPEQRRKIEALAAQYGLTISGWFEDVDRSGADFTREDWVAAMHAVEDRKAAGIIVATLDRYARDTVEGITIARDLAKIGGSLICGDLPKVSLVSAADEMMLTTMLMGATFERGRRREYLNMSRSNAVGRGVHLAIPFGYMREGGWTTDEDGNTVPARRGTALVIDQHEAKVVRLAFDLRGQGDSWAAIARQLNATGVLPRAHQYRKVKRQVSWTATRVSRMIDQQVYLGVAHSGANRTEGAHPAIVTQRQWDAAHKSTGTRFKTRGDQYLLTGLLRCASCGYTLARSHQLSAGRRLGYYNCTNQSCQARANISADAIEAWVVDTFYSEPFVDITMHAEPLDDNIGALVAAVDQRQAEYDAAVERWLTVPPGARSANLVVAAEKAMGKAEAALESARRELTKAQAEAKRLDLPADFVLRDDFDQLDVHEKRFLLSTVYAAIVIRRGAPGAAPDGRAQTVYRLPDVPTGRAALVDYVRGLAF